HGVSLVSQQMISFFGGIDPQSGIIVQKGHERIGESIANKILVFPTGTGSTVGSYTLYRLKQNHCAPLAIVNAECEPITAVGCIIAEIPCVDQIPIESIPHGVELYVDGEVGSVEF
ncbi:MAG: aconitase X swivel domain-containing protein, partial [Anaerolineales bacterium]